MVRFNVFGGYRITKMSILFCNLVMRDGQHYFTISQDTSETAYGVKLNWNTLGYKDRLTLTACKGKYASIAEDRPSGKWRNPHLATSPSLNWISPCWGLRFWRLTDNNEEIMNMYSSLKSSAVLYREEGIAATAAICHTCNLSVGASYFLKDSVCFRLRRITCWIFNTWVWLKLSWSRKSINECSSLGLSFS